MFLDMPFEDIVGKIKSSPTISLTILTQHRTEDALAPRKGDAAPKEKGLSLIASFVYLVGTLIRKLKQSFEITKSIVLKVI